MKLLPVEQKRSKYVVIDIAISLGIIILMSVIVGWLTVVTWIDKGISQILNKLTNENKH